MARTAEPWIFDASKFILDAERLTMPCFARAAWYELFAMMIFNKHRSGVLVGDEKSMVGLTHSDTYEQGLAAIACIGISGTADVYFDGYKLEGDVRVTKGIGESTICGELAQLRDAVLAQNKRNEIIIVSRSLFRLFKRNRHKHLCVMTKRVFDTANGTIPGQLALNWRIDPVKSISVTKSLNPQLHIDFKAQSGVPPSAERAPAAAAPLSTAALVPFSKNEENRKKDWPPGFALFWRSWPSHFRKKSSARCLAIWNRKKLEPFAAQIVASVRAHCDCRQWAEKGGMYIPGPEPWLNQDSWEVPLDSLGGEDPEADETGFVRREPADWELPTRAELGESNGNGGDNGHA